MRYCYESCAPGWVIKVAVPVPDTVVATALTPSIPEYKILIQFMIKHRTLHCNLSVRSHIFALNGDGLTDYDDDRGGFPLVRNLFHLRKEEVHYQSAVKLEI